MNKSITTLALLAAMLAVYPISAYARTNNTARLEDNNAPKSSLSAKAFFERIQRDGS